MAARRRLRVVEGGPTSKQVQPCAVGAARRSVRGATLRLRIMVRRPDSRMCEAARGHHQVASLPYFHHAASHGLLSGSL